MFPTLKRTWWSIFSHAVSHWTGLSGLLILLTSSQYLTWTWHAYMFCSCTGAIIIIPHADIPYSIQFTKASFEAELLFPIQKGSECSHDALGLRFYAFLFIIHFAVRQVVLTVNKVRIRCRALLHTWPVCQYALLLSGKRACALWPSPLRAAPLLQFCSRHSTGLKIQTFVRFNTALTLNKVALRNLCTGFQLFTFFLKLISFTQSFRS